MGKLRRASSVLLAVPLCAACLSPALTPAAAARSARAAAAPPEPIGGPQLGSRGVVVDRTAGLRPPKLPGAASYLIADGDTGDVLAARDPHGRYLPASTLKTLTAIALIPKLDSDALVRPTQRTCDVVGTKVGMTPKLKYKVADLFRAALMVSGNDAAVALTQAHGGYRRALATMNAEARRLRAHDTLAGSPNGLDVDLGLSVKTQHTSAYDLALIMRQGLRLRDFRKYVGTVNARWPALPTKKQRKKGKKVGGYPIYSHDRLLPGEPYAYPGMIGGKNGYTNAAQQTYVGAARRGGHTIIVALMHSPTLWSYATRLLDWGFKARGKVRPVGRLVDPVDAAKPQARHDGNGSGTGAAGPLDRLRAGNDSGTGWLLPLAGAGAAAVAAGGLIVTVRRRRGVADDGPQVVAWDLSTGNVSLVEPTSPRPRHAPDAADRSDPSAPIGPSAPADPSDRPDPPASSDRPDPKDPGGASDRSRPADAT
ncbi:MAG TPA: D-alanyl-D-alanine carboxypeptidase [Streptosporangiaceae bacterium]|nr:D-alanyl-D-alanine carboxypeptidase [Streptosporangiaceae bacterium]